MELNERVKLVRKKRGLTQREFAERLGVTDGAISFLESGRNQLTDQMGLAICRAFGVNEEWLRVGDGEMFIETDNTIITALAAEFRLDELDKAIIGVYLELPEEKREAVKGFIVEIANAITNEHAGQGDGEAGDASPPFTLPRSVAVPYAKSVDAARQLTEDEAVELVRERYAAAKKGMPSSMEFMRDFLNGSGNPAKVRRQG